MTHTLYQNGSLYKVPQAGRVLPVPSNCVNGVAKGSAGKQLKLELDMIIMSFPRCVPLFEMQVGAEGQLQVIVARPGYIKTLLPIETRHLNNHKVRTDTCSDDTDGRPFMEVFYFLYS
jgi:hypothetical protein